MGHPSGDGEFLGAVRGQGGVGQAGEFIHQNWCWNQNHRRSYWSQEGSNRNLSVWISHNTPQPSKLFQAGDKMKNLGKSFQKSPGPQRICSAASNRTPHQY